MSAPPHLASGRERRRRSRPPVEVKPEPTAADRARVAAAREAEYAERLRAALAEVAASGPIVRDRDLWPITRQGIFSAAVTAAGIRPGLPYADARRIRREVLGPLLDELGPEAWPNVEPE